MNGDAVDTSEELPSTHAPVLQPGSLMCVCGEHADAAAHAPTGDDEIERLRDELLTAQLRGDGWRRKFNTDTDEIARLRLLLADRDEWMNDLAEQLSSLLLAVPRPLRTLIAKRGDRIRSKVYGEPATSTNLPEPS